MSFFKDFKDDLAQAVNELMPEEERGLKGFADDEIVNTLDEEVDVEAELNKLNGLLEEVRAEKEDTVEEEVVKEAQEDVEDTKEVIEEVAEEITEEVVEAVAEETVEEAEEVIEEAVEEAVEEILEEEEEELIVNTMEDIDIMEIKNEEKVSTEKVWGEPSAEVTVITAGTKIIGNIESNGSIEIQGSVSGNIDCNGKITITGEIKGDTKANEVYADNAKIEGEVDSIGTVKIGMGSVVVGNVSATSAVVAGAIKGDIDVKGPVVVDASAVVMGNIKSRSVQINNGAVIEGFCSQCYSEVDVQSIFGEKK